MTPPFRTLAAALLSAGTLAACAQQPSATAANRPSRAVLTACRQEVDRVYAAQNRADLSMRDQRDTPLSDNYVSGITSRGLSSAYGRDNQMAACVRNAQNGSDAPATASPAPGLAPTGPTFTPVGK